MHKINPGTETKYRIVQCQDPFCNICTSTVLDGYDMSPSPPPSQGMVVYTCNNPSCSLCDGDYSLLLDIIHPTVSTQEDWVLVQEQKFGNTMTSSFTSKRDNISQETSRKTVDSAERTKRKLSGHLGCTAKLRRQSRDIGDDLINSVDDNQLMNLAMELELDKIDCLPDLHKDVITELSI